MKKTRWQLIVGIGLVVLSAVFYVLHYWIFRDPHHILIFLIGDIAFVFIEVLMVTLIIHELLNEREKRARFEKLNMVVGVFFSDVGTKLLGFLASRDPHGEKIPQELLFKEGGPGKNAAGLEERLKGYDYTVEIEKEDIDRLKALLQDKKDFLLRLLENPNILEHETFTDLLQAVFHLAEELEYREDLKNLPRSDRAHLAGDMKRAYRHLAYQWLSYMGHLQGNYPYLFHLANRMNPFDRNASPIVRES